MQSLSGFANHAEHLQSLVTVALAKDGFIGGRLVYIFIVPCCPAMWWARVRMNEIEMENRTINIKIYYSTKSAICSMTLRVYLPTLHARQYICSGISTLLNDKQTTEQSPLHIKTLSTTSDLFSKLQPQACTTHMFLSLVLFIPGLMRTRPAMTYRTLSRPASTGLDTRANWISDRS